MVKFSQFSVYSAVVKESVAAWSVDSELNCEYQHSHSLITVCVCICAREMNVLAATYRMCIYTSASSVCSKLWGL